MNIKNILASSVGNKTLEIRLYNIGKKYIQ